MKKNICIFLVCSLLLSCLIGCGSQDSNNSKSKSDEITLTIENYSDYLSISVNKYFEFFPDDQNGTKLYKPSGTGTCSDTFYLSANVEGVSTNFNYNGVEVIVRVTASCDMLNWETKEHENKDYSEEFTLTTNISGNLKDGCENEKMIKTGNYIANSDFACDVTYEVISISGSLTPISQ